MSDVSSLWWTDERIEATLGRQYVFGQLQPEYQSQLFQILPWGEGLTSETYLEWILTKAGKLFLILNELGIPHRIFNLAGDFVDDSDLPFNEARVGDLPLTQDQSSSSAAALNKKFFLTQWRYLVRGIAEGEHVKYTENEGVPVEVLKTSLVNSNNRDGVEKVVLSGAVCRVFLRTQVSINAAPHFSEEDEVLEEIRSLRQLSHEHVLSIYGSYFVDDSLNILFNGVYDRTLMSFLADTPQNFKRLPKPDRREVLVNWPHCLVNGLAWLHANGHAHGSIRPSNILVDGDYRIFLGHFEALDTLLDPPKINDIEAYQYAAPERWIRTTAIQEVVGAKNTFHSGGRTTRMTSSSKPQPSNTRASWMTSSSSQSSESRGTVIRVASRTSLVSSSSSGSGGSHPGRSGPKIFRTKPILYTPSIASSNLAADTRTRPVTAPENAATIPFVPHNTALVRTWQSQQVNAQFSDIFSLGAVITDIFTFLCERKISSFANHRSAKNRTPGRGGGVADASFHLITNLPQVSSWLTLLTQDSKKRKGLAFRAVEPMLTVVRDMVARSPEKRPTAGEIEAKFAHTIRQLEGILLAHCKQAPAPAVMAPLAKLRTAATAPVDLPLPPSPKQKEMSHRRRSKVKAQPLVIDHNSDSDLEPAYVIENPEKKVRPKKSLRLRGLGYDFDFPFSPTKQRDGYSSSTDLSSNPPSSGGSSIHDHMKDFDRNMAMHMAMKAKDQSRRKHKHQNKFILKDKDEDKDNNNDHDNNDRNNNALGLDDTFYHLRKALEDSLDQRRYFDELNLPRYEA
jgi:serine/threonine protein kinase